MRHPFDGIVIPAQLDETNAARESAGGQASSRRSALRWLLAAPAAVWGWTAGRWAAADTPGLDAPARQGSHRLYLVAPKDSRNFKLGRRKELGILGEFVHGWKGKKELARTLGYLAWLTAEQAQKIRGEADIAGVHQLGPSETAAAPQAGPASLLVVLAPNLWQTKPKEDTFETAEAVGKQWSQQFADDKVKVAPMRQGGRVVVAFGPGPIPQKVVDAVRSHPQAASIEWQGMATTLALGEEGERPTTKAVGEEGGRPPAQPTTLAVGEEGARPPTTTQALGEEGGPMSPRRPATTHALGEEGGPRVPPGQVTTMALGEEGNPPAPPPRRK